MFEVKKGIKSKVARGKEAFVDKPVFQGGLVLLLIVGMCVMGSLASAAPSSLTITIGTFFPYYSPKSVQIRSGSSISWENPTADLHSITHDACRTHEPCAFDSGALGPKRSFTLNQLPPGYYSYHCSFHPIMRGVLIVKESNTSGEI